MHCRVAGSLEDDLDTRGLAHCPAIEGLEIRRQTQAEGASISAGRLRPGSFSNTPLELFHAVELAALTFVEC